MDNNLINIDDLVRQRLGGAREPELPGAWSRMEALLDKDDRRRPVGLYWKRAMTYTGVALLMAAVSVGGYEMMSVVREPGKAVAGNIPDRVGATTDMPTKANSATTGTNAVGNTADEATAGTVERGNSTGNAGKAHTTRRAANRTAENYKAANGVVKTSPADGTRAAADVAIIPPASTEGTTIEHVSTRGNATGGKVAVVTNKVTPTANNNIADNNKSTSSADKKNNVSTVATVKNKVGTKNATTATQQNDLSVLSATTTAGTSSVTTQTGKKNARIITASNKATGVAQQTVVAGTANAGSQVAHAGKGNQAQKNGITANSNTVGNNASVATADKGVVNVAGNVPARPSLVNVTKPTEPVKVLPGKKVIERIVMHKTTFGTPGKDAVTRLDTISVDQVVMEMKNNEARKQAAQAAAEAAEQQKAEQQKLAKQTAAANTTVTGNKTAAAKGNANNAGNNKANTFAATTPGSKNAQGKNTATTATPANGSVAAAANGSVTTNGSNVDEAETTVDITPAAAPNAVASATPSAPAPATPNPESAAPASNDTKVTLNKKKHGLNMAEGLSRMFNDVKYKISGVQFAPGITAGINGTFFGPNSFKGFQFGMTGAFEMDDKWSLFTELKYFNRVNNNYAMYDYYNQYTPSGGAYLKDSTRLSFSFSTLHSFELPVSIRYTAGRFGFFGGANFMYALAVNTGGVPEVIAAVPTATVATIGNNATRNIQDNDFKSRFGIGYTVGINCMVTPNLSFDFRNVQNVWDNGKTPGAQTVSKQLYRSPSLQFSLMYRLGKGKDKE